MRTLFLLLGFFIFLNGCSSVPVTGRRQINIMSDRKITANSLTTYKNIIRQSKLSTNKRYLNDLSIVSIKLIDATKKLMTELGRYKEIKDFEWEVKLIENDSVVNAFCLPGGKIVVYTGIMPIAKNQDGLAVVIGHEIAHAIAKHGNERVSQIFIANLGAQIVGTIVKDKSNATKSIVSSVYGIGVKLGAILPYNRIQETEADRLGIVIMSKAGFNPNAAIPFWERMMKTNPTKVPEFFSTHPVNEKRIANLKKFIADRKKD